MNNEYENILEEEVNKYAPHYYQYFESSILKGKADFAQHMEQTCDFDEEFYESIFYQGYYFLDQLNDYEKTLYKKGLTIQKIEEERNRHKAQMMDTLKKDFMQRFMEFYVGYMVEAMETAQQDLAFSKQDEQYYIDRAYIGEEEDIGGVVTEEERMDMIQSEKRNQVRLEEQLSYWKESIEQVKGKQVIYA